MFVAQDRRQPEIVNGDFCMALPQGERRHLQSLASKPVLIHQDRRRLLARIEARLGDL